MKVIRGIRIERTTMKVIHLISGGDSGGAKTHVMTLLGALQEVVEIQLVCLTEGPLYDEALIRGYPLCCCLRRRGSICLWSGI